MKALTILLLLCSLRAVAQQTLQGKVVDENNKPIPNASVFLNNTSIGTRANDEGQFQLQVPAGRHELIVSSVGYQTHSQAIGTSATLDFLTVRLSLKAEELETVVVEPFEKDGWTKWGRFFIENFIGMSGHAKDCEIRNTGAIRFRHSKKNGELQAFASEPLVIENKALGYRIHYQLESFSYYFKDRYLIFTGYPFFEEMKGSTARKKRWSKERAAVFEGSMLHFMRAVYRNKILEEGFEVRRLRKIPNTEKRRIRELYASNVVKTPTGTMTVTSFEPDSAAYYEKILGQDDQFDVIGKNILPGDSIAYAVDATTAGMDFSDYLLVIFKNKLAPPAYQKLYPKSSTAMMSQITLIQNNPIEIQANGSYFNPADLLCIGFWGWSEKMAMMLPFDYERARPREERGKGK